MDFKATDIASFLNGEIVGDDDVKAYRMSRKSRKEKEGSLAFLANPKYEHYIYETKASIVLCEQIIYSPQRNFSYYH